MNKLTKLPTPPLTYSKAVLYNTIRSTLVIKWKKESLLKGMVVAFGQMEIGKSAAYSMTRNIGKGELEYKG